MVDVSRVDDRYTRPSRSRRLVLTVLAAVLAVAGLVWLVVTALHWSTPDVAGRVKAYEVKSTELTTVTLTVDRSEPNLPAVCKVFVQAANFERVGEKEITVPGGATRVQDVTVDVRTFRRGTSASLQYCRLAR